MPTEPAIKRAISFFDGQNLFHTAKTAFGHDYPNYDPSKLAEMVCRNHDWQLEQVRFYTGVPSVEDKPQWHEFWTKKLAVMGTRGVHHYTRPLKYRNQTVRLPDGKTHTMLVGSEKGIDIRIALDIVRLAMDGAFDVALVFSQDQDLSEVADEIRVISHAQGRWIKIASAYPSSPTSTNRRGINSTDWIPIDRASYDACLDPNTYK